MDDATIDIDNARYDFLLAAAEGGMKLSGNELEDIHYLMDFQATKILDFLKAADANTYSTKRGEILSAKSEMVNLVKLCHEMAVSPPAVLVKLVAHCVGNPPSTTTLFFRKYVAAEFGVSLENSINLFKCAELEATTSTDDVHEKTLADALNEPRTNVRRWRKTDAYREHVEWLRQEKSGHHNK